MMDNETLNRELQAIAAKAGDACKRYCWDEYMCRKEIFKAVCRAASLAYRDAAECSGDVDNAA